MKKRLVFGLLIVFMIIIFIVNIGVAIKVIGDVVITGEAITGKVSSQLTNVTIYIGFAPSEVTIHSPENKTYNFSIGSAYTIDLNVSANFNPNKWWYTLIDLKHDIIVNDTIFFTPNTTFNAVRWSNKLIAYANDSSGDVVNDSVIFSVFVPNSAPIITGIPADIYVCENNYLSHYFNVTDNDEQVLEMTLSPTNPFYISPLSTSGEVVTRIELFSGVLSKDGVGIYKETISASDGEYADHAYTNITVIEINNAPDMENIGVQTIWTRGENRTFSKQVQVDDTEDGDQDSGNLIFNLTFLTGEKLFNINEYGIMNFTANSSHIGVYNISVCVNDSGIENPHANISLCGQDGSSIKVCQNFSLTITDENRAPTITDYYPTDTNLNVNGTDTLYFNVTEYDPDGTIPDAYWYADNSFKEYDSGSSIDEFTYSFGCGISGTHTIKVVATDGLLNDSVQWSISVQEIACPLGVGVGGGGGGGREVCEEEWVCNNWKVCQNAKKSLESGFLSGRDYRVIQDYCLERKWDERVCGFQMRICDDFNSCSTTLEKPKEIQSCYYTEKPSCSDGIKNCHLDSCEILIDCGGPCKPCPTCSDKIKNQGEAGIDCGGPCPWACPPEKALLEKRMSVYILIAITLALLVIIILMIIKLIRIIKVKKKIKEYKIIKRRK